MDASASGPQGRAAQPPPADGRDRLQPGPQPPVRRSFSGGRSPSRQRHRAAALGLPERPPSVSGARGRPRETAPFSGCASTWRVYVTRQGALGAPPPSVLVVACFQVENVACTPASHRKRTSVSQAARVTVRCQPACRPKARGVRGRPRPPGWGRTGTGRAVPGDWGPHEDVQPWGEQWTPRGLSGGRRGGTRSHGRPPRPLSSRTEGRLSSGPAGFTSGAGGAGGRVPPADAGAWPSCPAPCHFRLSREEEALPGFPASRLIGLLRAHPRCGGRRRGQ